MPQGAKPHWMPTQARKFKYKADSTSCNSGSPQRAVQLEEHSSGETVPTEKVQDLLTASTPGKWSTRLSPIPWRSPGLSWEGNNLKAASLN